MKKYDEYKDSGVPWIGEIPKVWEISKIKYSTYVKGRIGWQGLKSDEFVDEGPYLVTGTDLVNGNIVWETCYHISEERYNEAPQIQLENGDLLITKDGTIGKIAIVTDKPDKAILNSGLFVTRPLANIYITKFMYWVLNSKVFWSYYGYLETGSTIKHLYQETFENFSFPLPDLATQKSISNYLDRKTTTIDSLIEDKQKLIELLKEKRQAVISEAVTKGLDKNAKMKDSGIEWIGEIPEDWKRTKLKNLLYIPITDGPHETPEILDEGIPFISAEAIKNLKIDFNLKRGYISIDNHLKFCKKCKPEYGVIFMIKSGATTGNVAMVETYDEFSIWSPLALIRSNPNIINNKYLFYCLQSRPFKLQVELFWSFGTQQNIGMGVLGNLYLSYPETDVQIEIVSYLNTKTAEIDNLVDNITEQIEKLKEYRQAIISEAVTGKVAI